MQMRGHGRQIVVIVVAMLVVIASLYGILYQTVWYTAVDLSSGRSRVQLRFCVFFVIKESTSDTDFSRLLVKHKGVHGTPRWNVCAIKHLSFLPGTPRIQTKLGGILQELQNVSDALSMCNVSEAQKAEVLDVVYASLLRGERMYCFRGDNEIYIRDNEGNYIYSTFVICDP